MNEERQPAYYHLIEELIANPEKAGEILNANPDLLDAELVKLLQISAATLQQRGDRATANWLQNLASALEEFIGETSPDEGNKKAEADMLLDGGNEQYYASDFRGAFQSWQQALTIYREIGNRRGEATSLGNLGSAYHSQGRYHEAIDFYQQSLKIAREIGDRRGEANSLGSLGNAYYSLGRYDEAINFYQQALKIKREIGDLSGEAASLGSLGNAYNFLGKYDEAIGFYQQSLNIGSEIGDRRGEAASLGNLGNAYNSLGRYNEAIALHQQSLKIKREIGDRSGEAASLGSLGNAYYSLGRYDEAIDFHQQSLTIERQIGNRFGEANSLEGLGVAYNSLERYIEAINFHQQSLKITREIGDRRGEAASLGNLGSAYDSLGRYKEAIAFQQQSLKIKKGIGDRVGEIYSLNSLGNAYRNLQQIPEAIQILQDALKLCTPSGFPVESITVGRTLGYIAFDAQRYSEAIVGYEAAIEAVEMRCSWESSETGKRKLREGALDIYEKMIQSCIYNEQLDKALETVERSKSRNLVELFANADLYPENASDELKQQLNQLRRRIAAAQQLLEQVGAGLAENLSHSPTTSQQNPPFPDANPLQRSGATFPLSSDSLQQQRQILQESLQQLNELFTEIKQTDPKFTLTQRVESISIAEIRSLIDDKTAILEWYIGIAGFYIFILTGDNLQVEQFDSDALQQLETWKEEYLEDYNPQPTEGESEENYQQRRQQQQKNWRNQLESRLTQLAQILRLNEIIAKIPDTCQQLLLIPHRYLHLLPLHALSSSTRRGEASAPESAPPNPNLTARMLRPDVRAEGRREERSLLDLFPAGVRYAPSCQLLQQVQIRKRLQEDSRLLFAIQNPTVDLTYTDVEVETIQRSFDPNHVLPREKATKAAFTQDLNILRSAYYAHFSCHGAFNFQYPLLSSLVLADSYEIIALEEHQSSTPTQRPEEKKNRYLTLRNGRKANPEKCLTLGEIFASLDLPNCHLVTLSACETGLTDPKKFIDEPIGLPSGFLYAGSLSVVSSLWCVDDLATAVLMIKFYQNLQANIPIALALNSAQSWLRRATVQQLRDWISELNIDEKAKQNFLEELEIFNVDEIRFASTFYWGSFCASGQ